MALRDLAGTQPLQEALAVTNAHLEAVLAELQETNRRRLDEVATELRAVNERLDRLLAQG